MYSLIRRKSQQRNKILMDEQKLRIEIDTRVIRKKKRKTPRNLDDSHTHNRFPKTNEVYQVVPSYATL